MFISGSVLIFATYFMVVKTQFTERIKGHDEPQLISYRLLEGVTEPFELPEAISIPLWQTMKQSADTKAAQQLYQDSLHEYGQLLKNPLIFGDMPMKERYDVFISMSRLLKTMGFFEKAELLLYEAISYSQEPYEAHYQLSLLLLDKEDINSAKVHLKNCLFYKESDISMLVYLSVLLVAEGKMHEASYYISRILMSLEIRINKLSYMLGTDASTLLEGTIDYPSFFASLEDLIIRVFKGEYMFIPSASLEQFRFFSNLFEWLSKGEMSGRFLFDLGQSLYERGKPDIGRDMMARGHMTEDLASEGFVSTQIVRYRLAMEYPSIPSSLFHIIESYLNITDFLATQSDHRVIDLENIIDTFWPLPLLWWSALPMAPVLQEYVSNNFIGGKVLKDVTSLHWLHGYSNSKYCYNAVNESNIMSVLKAALSQRKDRKKNVVLSKGHSKINIGIFGGHFNSHLIGQFILHNVINTIHNNDLFHTVLIALPLVPDSITRILAKKVDHVVNIPASTSQAWDILESLSLDIVLFPDWQPFPDQQSIYFQTRRIAPVQICLFLRGSSCAFNSIDYYLLPSDMEKAYYDSFSSSPSSGWRELWSEQVVLLDWPVITSKIVGDIFKSVMATAAPSTNSESNYNVLAFTPRENEGKVFFSGQPVALIPFHPSYLHPLMDDIIYTLLRSIHNLQLVIAIPEIYAAILPSSTPNSQSFNDHKNDDTKTLSVEWGRRLARRLWSGGGNLHQRIRLLPSPLSDIRLLQLMRQADVVLDSYPIGSSLHPLALALSVGTPIITFRSGIQPETPSKVLRDIKRHLQTQSSNKRFQSNPMHQHLLNQYASDIPWRPSLSVVASYLDRLNLTNELVVSNTTAYAAQAARIVSDKEWAYEIRVRLLDAVDSTITDHTADVKDNNNSDINNSEGNDFERFLKVVGTPWASARSERHQYCP